MKFMNIVMTISLIVCLYPSVGRAHTEITMETLLQEMVNRDANAQIPSPYYFGKQVSSWDRQQAEGNWFANRDSDYYIRKEVIQGRTEYVVLEDGGPGCITRMWRPLNIGDTTRTIPQNTIRFYLDDALVIEADVDKLTSGQSIFHEPFSVITSDEKDSENQIGLPPGMKQMGGNLNFPIPYARNCKVTMESTPLKEPAPPHNVFYYIINYRSYEPGTSVKTFNMKEYESSKSWIAQIGEQLSNPGTNVKECTHIPRKEETLEPGKTLSMVLPSGPRAVRKFVLELDPKVAPSILRNLFVSMSFDGEKTVWCPVSEFFGGGYFPKDVHPESPEPDGIFIRPHWNRNRQVEENGRFSCYFVMPYKTNAKVEIVNKGDKSVPVKASVGIGNWTWDDSSMYFHANWRNEETPAEFADWNYIEIKGQGIYVADTLSVYNPVAGWYGEGDERIYIDGESFPSHLGTGTEDYYGFAWGMAGYYSSSFLSNPSRDSRGKGDWSGYQTISRERTLDGITFKKSLKMDMEAWNGAGVIYSAGTMWYARPGASSNRILE